MKLKSQHITYIKYGFSKMKTINDLLALLNYIKLNLVIENISYLISNIEDLADVFDFSDAEEDKYFNFKKNTILFDLEEIKYFARQDESFSYFYGIRYQQFGIRKKSGKSREINAPNDKLKLLQRCLNQLLEIIFQPHRLAMGFVPNKSIVDNARIHTGNNYVYNIDLKDFFTNINSAQIEACLMTAPFNLNGEREILAQTIAGLCCRALIVEHTNENGKLVKITKSVLPQGAPTSPVLSNIVAYSLDVKLSYLAKRFNLRYSRYADDITFSSMQNVYENDSDFIKELRATIEAENFIINENKIRLQEKNLHSQVVTGLVVNEKVNVKRRYIKQIRSWLYLWKTYGYEQANLFFQRDYRKDKGYIKQGTADFAHVLLGKLKFLKMVVGSDDKRYKRFIAIYIQLDKEYKKQIKEAIQLEEITPSVILQKIRLPHTPKDTWQFLKLFDDVNGFKYLVHDFDNSELEFSRKTIVTNAKKVYNRLKNELTIPETLSTKLNNFAFKPKPKWWTWEKGEEEKFYIGWSSKELIEWCDVPINEGVHPFRNAKYLNNMITPFKNCIELRKGKLEKLFTQAMHSRINEKFEVKFIDAHKAAFLTDVNVFQSGLRFLFNPFKENAENNNSYTIEIAFKRELVNNYRMKVITITHLDSMPHKHSTDEDLIKGDLKEARERFRNLCNWSIEAKFEDGFKRVNILNDNPEIPKIEEINKTEVGFTHILSFY